MRTAEVINLEGVKPIVRSPRLIKHKGFNVKNRKGRGFSVLELKEVGLSIRDARKIGLPVDKRRRSKREENIKILKEFLESLMH